MCGIKKSQLNLKMFFFLFFEDKNDELYKRHRIAPASGVPPQDVHGVQGARADRKPVHHEETEEQTAPIIH